MPAHHPQERRRLQLLHHGPGHHPVPGGRAPLSTARSTWSAPTRRCTSRWSSRWPGRRAGYPPGTSFEHAQIGMVLGPDGNRLRTRSGDNAQLSDLLEEAVERARAILDELDAAARFDAAELDEVAEAVGIGAVKYADLSTARESAYVFDWDRMISFRGNTGPYLQYATARIRSIFRRAARGGRARRRRTAGTEDAARRRRRDHRGPRTRARAEAARLRRGHHPRRRDRGTAPAVRVPVRGGQPVHHVLRGVPGAEGGVRRRSGPAGSRSARSRMTC